MALYKYGVSEKEKKTKATMDCIQSKFGTVGGLFQIFKRVSSSRTRGAIFIQGTEHLGRGQGDSGQYICTVCMYSFHFGRKNKTRKREIIIACLVLEKVYFIGG